VVKDANVAIVKTITEKFANNSAAFFMQYHGLSVEVITEFRAKLKAVGAEMKVYKNTFTHIALHSAKEGLAEQVAPILKGPTAVIFANADAVAAAKVIQDMVKANEVAKIKCGLLETSFLSASAVKELAALPPREVLIAKVLMLFNSPISGFVNVLQGNARKLVYTLSAIQDQRSKQG
jgi:large subunit ribosomal protein L10